MCGGGGGGGIGVSVCRFVKGNVCRTFAHCFVQSISKGVAQSATLLCARIQHCEVSKEKHEIAGRKVLFTYYAYGG